MKVGDLVRFNITFGVWRLGIFLGYRVSGDYKYSEVLWSDKNKISSVQSDLLEVINEGR